MYRFNQQSVLVTMFLGLAVVLGSSTPASAQQENGNSLVGTWFLQSQQLGGINRSYYTFAPNGHWENVSILQGGPRSGQETQRWGQYQAQQIGPGRYQVTVQIQGGAPRQVCAQGQGCTQVNIQMSRLNLTFEVHGAQMRQSDGTIFQRTQLPQQLAQQMPDTIYQRPVPNVGGTTTGGGRNGGPATNIPGLGGNCDDAQQNRICTVNSGRMYRDPKTGCMICAGP